MTNHIKIYGVKPRIQYVADGNLKTYEFPFAIFKTSDIDVYFNDKLQEKITYSVSTVPDTEGGRVVFETAPQNGTVITIMRNLSIERTSDFQEGGSLRAKVLNDEFDYQIACQQQIADNLNRSMVMPPYAADTDVDLTLPTPSPGKAIVWNKDGTNLENSTVEVNILENTLKGYKETAEQAASIASQKAEETIMTLSSKADNDMDNLTTVGKINITSFTMPSETFIDLNLGESGSYYTMPANGYILFSKKQTAANEKISLFLRHPTLDNTNILATEVSDLRGYVNLKVWLPVPKDGKIEVQYDATGNTTAFRFYYAKGEI